MKNYWFYINVYKHPDYIKVIPWWCIYTEGRLMASEDLGDVLMYGESSIIDHKRLIFKSLLRCLNNPFRFLKDPALKDLATFLIRFSDENVSLKYSYLSNRIEREYYIYPKKNFEGYIIKTRKDLE